MHMNFPGLVINCNQAKFIRNEIIGCLEQTVFDAEHWVTENRSREKLENIIDGNAYKSGLRMLGSSKDPKKEIKINPPSGYDQYYHIVNWDENNE
ncbi:hypothetical protein HK096_011184, partial [Nowakowskiella sp. JEL0078]